MKTWLAHSAAVSALFLVACSGSNATPAGQTPAPAMIPVTATSPQAIAHFERGRDLLDNLRFAEAADAFSEALAIEPTFVSAHALHGAARPGPEGLREIEQAAIDAKALPQAERLAIDALLATRQGDLANSENLLRQLVELAPGDWRAHYLLGMRLFAGERYEDAAAAFERAIALDSKAGPAYNMLGYASLRRGEVEPAVSAFTQYASVNPKEPNAQDSLGEALVGAGRFSEAEAAFQKAADLSPRFWNAWEGIAYSKFYAGDSVGAREALGKGRRAAERTVDAVAAEEMFAWIALAERKTAEALKAFDAAEHVSGAQPSDVALVPVHRALALADAGRHREALAQVAAVLQRADKGEFPPGLTRNVRRQALVARAMAEAAQKNAAALDRTIAALTKEASDRPEDANLQSSMHFARGLAGVVKGDLDDARKHFGACSAQDATCQWQNLLAAQRSGDAAAAEAVRAWLTRIYVRDPDYLYVRARLNQLAARSTS